ncbi:transposase, partial [Enterobacter hormaechei subsp. hoffmannii]|nr:transposase [Enterobacter hormaechei subsp. hoffmannii]MCU3567451.1 transposase [Enterobacter hormaechei subsp. hoffmannii]MCU3601739.1 transposase [Enterobacter hormaechei subsp. hoffmannii]MCU3685791.1 transposase [Enterobacter hormaechei subsp. hoffmannii]MCU3700029.1 transposase [Enterobacter hormaechei subsp. hoffmannii]
VPAYGPQNDVTLKMPAFEWVHVQLHQQKGMISLSPPTICNSAIYTTNAIESLNSVIRQAIKKRKVFPTDDSVRKVIYLAIDAASKKWNMPIRDWRLAMSRFIIEFGDRLSNHL